MDTAAWIWLIAVLVVLAIAVTIAWRRRRLRQQFGPEHQRLADEQGTRKADSELAARRRRRRQLEIVPLDAPTRARFAAAWQVTQARFVDAPEAAIEDADRLVAEVMRERGYPVEDFEQRAADVSVDHPGVVQHYRAGHAIAQQQADSGSVTTEELRQAVVHYRALFDELLDDQKPERATDQTPDQPSDQMTDQAPNGAAHDGAAQDRTPQDRTPQDRTAQDRTV